MDLEKNYLKMVSMIGQYFACFLSLPLNAALNIGQLYKVFLDLMLIV